MSRRRQVRRPRTYVFLRLTGIPDWLPKHDTLQERWERVVGNVGVFDEEFLPSIAEKFEGCYLYEGKFHVPGNNSVSAMNTHYWGAYMTLDAALENREELISTE